MAKVWRIEHRESLRGLYTSSACRHAGLDTQSCARRPFFFNDALLNLNQPAGAGTKWRFCFLTLAQLRMWFPKSHRVKLAKLEHVIITKEGPLVLNCYEVPEAGLARGNTQALFREATATLIDTRCLASV